MMGTITTIHLILIAVLAVLTVCMIVFGMRLKAKRKAAEREVTANREEMVEHQAAAPPPEVVATPAAPAPTADPAAPSDLTRLKGLGPKLAAQLAERGLTRIEQIAALSVEDAATLDTQLGSFNGRLSRDRWVEQAKLLSAGDTPGYEAAFGKL